MLEPPRRLAAALTGVGAVLCVLGWYQISGQPTVAQQLPYLASATIPGAALLAAGAAALLRQTGEGTRVRTEASYRARSAGGAPPPGTDTSSVPTTPGTSSAPTPAPDPVWRVPDGRYLHAPDCPLLDGRTDAVAVTRGAADADDAESLRPCPLCTGAAPAAPVAPAAPAAVSPAPPASPSDPPAPH